MVDAREAGWTICATVSGDLYEECTIVEVRPVGDTFECVLEDAHGTRLTVMATKIERKN